jgi:hypothetical protein
VRPKSPSVQRNSPAAPGSTPGWMRSSDSLLARTSALCMLSNSAARFKCRQRRRSRPRSGRHKTTPHRFASERQEAASRADQQKDPQWASRGDRELQERHTSPKGGAKKRQVAIHEEPPFPLPPSGQAFSTPHHSAMNSAIVRVVLRSDSRLTRSLKPWFCSDLAPKQRLGIPRLRP